MEEDRQPAVARYRAQLIATPLDIYERLIFSTTTKVIDAGTANCFFVYLISN